MDVFNMSAEEFGKVASEIENSQDEANPVDNEVNEPVEDKAPEGQPEDTLGSIDEEVSHESSPNHDDTSNQSFGNEEEVTDSTVDQETASEPSESATPDYKQFYEEITKPIKVNGVELTFNDPNEIRTLASKGTDYTRKTQEIAAQRRYIDTLQNNGLLSDEQLNLLVGAAKGDKAALKQLIKQNDLTSDDLFGGYGGYGDDEEEENEQVASYVEPENLYNFKSTIKEISTLDGGNELLTNLRGWDAQSQNWVVENPAILNEIVTHKENGVYDQLNTEINRLRVLGQVPPDVPYLVLYKDLLGKLDPSALTPKPKAPIATGRGEPTGIRKPNPNASRASTPRGSMGNKAPKKPIDIFSLSDEEFKAKENEILKLIGD